MAVAITETLVRVDVGLVEMKATTIVTCIVEMPTGVVVGSFMQRCPILTDDDCGWKAGTGSYGHAATWGTRVLMFYGAART